MPVDDDVIDEDYNPFQDERDYSDDGCNVDRTVIGNETIDDDSAFSQLFDS